MDAAKFFAGLGGFIGTAAGTFLVAAGLAVPRTCYKLIDGEWLKCDGTSPGSCPIDTTPDLTGFVTFSFRCENFLGLDTFFDRQATAGVIALVLSLGCAFIAHELGLRALRRRSGGLGI